MDKEQVERLIIELDRIASSLEKLTNDNGLMSELDKTIWKCLKT